MYLERLKWIYRAWRYRLKVEKDEIRFVLRCLRAGDVAVDIGAHKGGFTYWMEKRVGPTGHVYAFEPQPSLAENLQKILAPSQSHTTLENMGLSSRVDEMVLTVPDDKPSPGASLESRAERQSHWRSYRVPVTTLDEYFSRMSAPIKLVKCDVEGHELEVFRGGEKLLRNHKPVLIFECETRHRQSGDLQEVFDYLSTLGYSGQFFLNGRLQSIDQFDVHCHQANPDADDYANNFVFTPLPDPAEQTRAAKPAIHSAPHLSKLRTMSN